MCIRDRMITDPIKANKILENDESDMIAMARAFLSNPRWGLGCC